MGKTWGVLSIMLQLCSLLFILLSISQSTLLDINHLCPRIVWTYWDGAFSPFVLSLLNSTRSVIGADWIFTLLTPDNYTLFVNNTEIPHYEGMAPPMFSDFLRFTLLSKFGGLWMDTTTLLTSETFLDTFRFPSLNNGAELVGFGVKSSLLTGMLYSPKGSKVVGIWLKQMHVMVTIGLQNYVYKQYRNGVSYYSGAFSHYPEVNLYQVNAVVEQVVLQRLIERHYPLFFFSSREYLFKLHQDCHLDIKCIARVFYNKTEMSRYTITKFTGYNRKYIDPTYHPKQRASIDPKPLQPFCTLDRRERYSYLINILFLLIWVILFIILCQIPSGHWNIYGRDGEMKE